MRILVVRAVHQAEVTAKALAQRGHAPILAPILAVVQSGLPPPASRPDALIVTSRNAIPALVQYRDTFAGIPVFAVGARNAETMAAEGFGPVASAADDGADLARTIAAAMSPGARLLHVAGRDRRPEPARSLSAAGYVVEVWETYAAEAVAALPVAARIVLEECAVDVVLHYSPRSAALLSRLATEAGLAETFVALNHCCLSANVGAALDGVAAGRIAVALAPDETHLLALLDELGRAD